MGAKKQIRNPTIFNIFSHRFISVMAESEATSLSDANLDFDDDTLKGKY